MHKLLIHTVCYQGFTGISYIISPQINNLAVLMLTKVTDSAHSAQTDKLKFD